VRVRGSAARARTAACAAEERGDVAGGRRPSGVSSDGRSGERRGHAMHALGVRAWAVRDAARPAEAGVRVCEGRGEGCGGVTRE
jgi:hypothetical protein